MDRGFVSNLLKGVVSTSFGSVVTIAFHFASVMLLTRFVEKDILGLYFLAMALVQVLKVVSGLGLDLTLTRLAAASDRDTTRNALASTIAIRVAALIVVSLIFFAAARLVLHLFDDRLDDFVVAIVVLFAFTSFEELFLNLMQGVRQFKGYAFVQVFSAASRVLLLVIFRNQLGLQMLLYIEIVSVLTAFLAQLFMTRGLLKGLGRQNVTGQEVRGLTKFSAPLYSNNILTLIYDRASEFLIGSMLGPASVAAYEVAFKIPDGFMRLFNSFVVVYFPSLSNLFGRGKKDDARRMINVSLVLLSVGILFLVLVAFLFANEIVVTLFSAQYADAAPAFAFLMLTFFLRATANIMGYSLVAAGHASAPVKANIVGVIVNIASSVVLIRIFGYIGAVYSLVLMNATSQVIYTVLLNRAGLPVNLHEYLKPVLLLGGLLGVHAILGTNSIALRLALIALYLVGCWFLVGEVRATTRSAPRHLAGLMGGRKANLAATPKDL